MRKALTLAGVCAASILGLVDTPSLFAHGGRYGGPTDTVPPNLGGPGDTTPPGNPGGPATPAPSAPTTGGTSRGPATPSGSAPTTGGAPRGRGGGPTGATKRQNSKGFEQWEFWWGANDEAYLDLKARMRQLGKHTTSRTVSFGARIDDPNAQVDRLTAEDRDRIQAVLIAALDSSDADVVDSSVLALARIVKSDQAAAVLPAIIGTLDHPMASARQSATLALGVLGAPEATATLRELLLDTQQGRRLTGQDQHVEDLVRAFAAASMGMIGAPEQIGDLQSVLVDDSLRAGSDVKSLALYSLGLIKGGHDRIVPFLQQQMAERSLDDVVRAQAPIALARIAEQPGGAVAARAALSSLVGFLTDDKRNDNDLKRSLAIAIGRIATMDDVEALATLADVVTREKDEQTRHFALIGLADVAARDTRAELHADGQRKLSELFGKLVSERKSAPQRPYAALALAIQGRNQGVDRELKDSARKLLLATFLDENNPSYRGAFAIGLGLLGADEARHDLAEALDDTHDVALSGYVGVSMGLMMARDRADDLRRRLEAKGTDPRMKLQFARALGLMGDPGALDVLVRTLRESETLAETSSAAQALGLIGDRDAVAPLLAMLGDAKQPALRRGFAAVGLGLLAEKSELPWNALFMIAANYRAKTPALAEIHDIL